MWIKKMSWLSVVEILADGISKAGDRRRQYFVDAVDTNKRSRQELENFVSQGIIDREKIDTNGMARS